MNYFNDSEREVDHYLIEVKNKFYELLPNNSNVLIDDLEAGHNYAVSAIALSNGVASKKLSINVGTGIGFKSSFPIKSGLCNTVAIDFRQIDLLSVFSLAF